MTSKKTIIKPKNPAFLYQPAPPTTVVDKHRSVTIGGPWIDGTKCCCNCWRRLPDTVDFFSASKLFKRTLKLTSFCLREACQRVQGDRARRTDAYRTQRAHGATASASSSKATQ